MLKDKKKRIILFRCTCVAIIFVVLLYASGKVFTPYYKMDTNQNKTFYRTEKDSVDVLIVGSSTLLVGLSPLELWENYGIVAHTRASTVQAPAVTWFNVKEAYKYQKPKVVVIGITSLFNSYDYDKNEPYVRRGMDFKKLSLDKLKTISEITERSNSQHILDYVFPILRYHDRWKDLQLADIQNLRYKRDFMRGQYPVYKSKPIESRAVVDKSVPAAKADPDSWSFYKKTIDYCTEQGSKVIVVNMPDDRWNYGKYLTAKDLLEKSGVEYIDFNLEESLEALSIDWNKDFYDPHHLNPVGAQKTTAYLGNYLIENHPEVPVNQCSDSTGKLLDEDVKQYHALLHDFEEKINRSEK